MLIPFICIELPTQVTYGDKITLDIKSNGKEEFLVHVRDW